jgi:hypothetical protein
VSDRTKFETGDTQQSAVHFPTSCSTFCQLFDIKLERTDIPLAFITCGSHYSTSNGSTFPYPREFPIYSNCNFLPLTRHGKVAVHATYVQCVRKVAVHLGYGTLQCAVVSLYSVVKQWLKCNTGKVCNCLIQFLLYRRSYASINSNTFYKCTATFRTHCTRRSAINS